MKILKIAIAALMLSGAAEAHDAVSRQCLANVIYREARGESLVGQRAVAHVVLNRVADRSFPDNVCAVVRQPGQFAPRASQRPLERDSYDKAKMVADKALRGLSDDPTHGATYFTTHGARAAWAPRMRVSAVIGGHKFMKSRK